MRVISDTKHPIKIWASDLEIEAEQQVRNLAQLPFIHSHVAVMPDAHAGWGSTIGTVIATRGAIIPSAVGVDMGCGMCAIKLPFKVDQLGNLAVLRASIERSIPVGRDSNKEISTRVSEAFQQLGPKSDKAYQCDFKRAEAQLGSLGGGNHFIEICTDINQNAWVMLHSGSRNIGKSLAELHINEAKGIMKKYFVDLPDPELAYLAVLTPEFNDYIKDLHFAQNYARANRNEMMLRILKDISFHIYGEDRDACWDFRVDCHHNYTSIEHFHGKNVFITRKGAVSARLGEYGIIPGSMGTKSYIVRGLGNIESFNSCSHGAGRKMSRTKAKNTFTIEDLANQTRGIECRKDAAILDEIPSSYKDIDQVMRDQSDLVEITVELKQLICIKGGD